MPQNLEALIHLLHFFLIIAAACATAFPIAYAFIPWYSTPIGRVLMLHGVALALALDVTIFFQYFRPKSLTFGLWIEIVVFACIAFANVCLTVILVRSQLGKSSTKPTIDGTITVGVSEQGNKVYKLELENDVDTLDEKALVVFKVIQNVSTP